MKLKIAIKMDNAAFEELGTAGSVCVNGEEPARILRQLTIGWKGTNLMCGESWSLYDINGNRVGEAKVTN